MDKIKTPSLYSNFKLKLLNQSRSFAIKYNRHRVDRVSVNQSGPIMKKMDKIVSKKKAALLLRFHTTTPSDNAPVYTTYADISRALRITYSQA